MIMCSCTKVQSKNNASKLPQYPGCPVEILFLVTLAAFQERAHYGCLSLGKHLRAKFTALAAPSRSSATSPSLNTLSGRRHVGKHVVGAQSCLHNATPALRRTLAPM